MAISSEPATKPPVMLPTWADELPSHWGWHQLEDVCLDIVDCPHSTPEVVEGGPYLMARTSDILSGVFRVHEARRVSEATYRERTRRAEPKYGDLLYSREGTYFGLAAEVPPETKVCLGQRMVLLRPDPERVHTSYLRYWLNSSRIQAHIDGHRDGSVAERLNLPTIRRLPISTPSLAEQRAIADVLGTLDDKSELNRRMNETLEATARALFKSWFVDFDPVRAKSEGYDPGLPKALADLFPDSFEESDLGEIPKGWGTHRLGDLLSLEKGLSYKGEFLTDSGTPMVNLGCFLGRGRFANQAIKKYSGEYRPRHVVGPRALVLANTDITQKREVLGSPALVPPQGDSSEFIFTHHVFAARFHKGKESWKLLVYFLLLQESFRQRAAGFATGTTVLALPRDAVLELSCPAVPIDLVHAFEDAALPLVERGWKSLEMSRTLADLRDILLSKLISGELRVKAAERIVADAV